jgi:hypothetical protein
MYVFLCVYGHSMHVHGYEHRHACIYVCVYYVCIMHVCIMHICMCLCVYMDIVCMYHAYMHVFVCVYYVWCLRTPGVRANNVCLNRQNVFDFLWHFCFVTKKKCSDGSWRFMNRFRRIWKRRDGTTPRHKFSKSTTAECLAGKYARARSYENFTFSLFLSVQYNTLTDTHKFLTKEIPIFIYLLFLCSTTRWQTRTSSWLRRFPFWIPSPPSTQRCVCVWHMQRVCRAYDFEFPLPPNTLRCVCAVAYAACVCRAYDFEFFELPCHQIPCGVCARCMFE